MTTRGDLLGELVPGYIGEELLTVELARPLDPRRAYSPIDVAITLAPSGVERGLALPIEIIVQAPSARYFERHLFRRSVPSSFSFTPKQGGRHLVRVQETGHNEWWGALVVDVAGDREEEL
jgi:hypothetical protein